MKKIIASIIICIFSLNVFAQDYQNDKMQKSASADTKYCAKMKAGKIIMSQDKKDLTSDVKLTNGITIKTDGTLVNSDGSQTILKNGECVDYNGAMIKDKMPKGNDRVPTQN